MSRQKQKSESETLRENRKRARSSAAVGTWKHDGLQSPGPWTSGTPIWTDDEIQVMVDGYLGSVSKGYSGKAKNQEPPGRDDPYVPVQEASAR